MLTIYGVYRSRAARPLWAALEAGCEFHHVPVVQAYRAASAPGTMTSADPEYLEVNPSAQVPAMVDGDLVLTESLAIVQYIAQRYGGDLGPGTAAESALITQWALFAATQIETPALEIQLTLSAAATGEAAEVEAIVRVAAEKLRRPLARLDRVLTDQPWLVNHRFTAADICVEECLRYAQRHPTLLDEFPEVSGWLARCQSRPAFKKMWRHREAEPT